MCFSTVTFENTENFFNKGLYPGGGGGGEQKKMPLFTEMYCFCYQGVTDKRSKVKFPVKIEKAVPTLL